MCAHGRGKKKHKTKAMDTSVRLVAGVVSGLITYAALGSYMRRRAAPSILTGPHARNRQPLLPPSAAAAPATSGGAVVVADVPRQKRYQVFDVPTQTLTNGSDVYVPLARFKDELRYGEEVAAFDLTVVHLDRLYTMESTLHGAGSLPRNAKLIAFAGEALSNALAQLDAIVQFGDTYIRSPTRRENLMTLRNAIKQVGEQTIAEMNDLMAGTFNV
jgi:hypothetical protein